ncbi:MAG TPA: TVP38/TMEM64 family protein [Planctomycetota bacterium]|nr:TVP38/TMEM64 family protein [Planctomycetota bacterium]
MTRLASNQIAALGFVAVCLIALAILGQLVPVEGVIEWLEGLGAWGPIALVGVFIVASIALVPGLILNITAGALFGVVVGSIAALAGSTLGAMAAFLIARTVGRKRLEKWLKGEKRVEALDAAVARSGFKVVVASRLSPGIPFNVLNYAFGVTRVSFRDFALGSLIGMIPYRIVYAYIGSVLGKAAGVRSPLGGDTSLLEWVLLVGGFATTLVFVIWVTRMAKAVLAEPVEERAGGTS